MELGPVISSMVGGLGVISPVSMEKSPPSCELEELLKKINDFYPTLKQERAEKVVNLFGNLPHVGQIKVQAEGKLELEEALNHLFLANTVACHFNEQDRKEFQVKAFVWTPKAKSLTLAYKGISAVINVQGYLAEGTVKLAKLMEQFKPVWEEAKRVKDLQQGYLSPGTCKHSFKNEAPLQGTWLPKALINQMLCKC